MPESHVDRLLTQGEVAARLRVSVETIAEWRRQGRLRAIVLGWKCVRIAESELERFIEEGKRAGRES